MTVIADLNEETIAARLERLPQSRWHTRLRVIIGTATFFDAFDSIAIAAVLPSLIALWTLSSQQIGTLISIGFAGQALGALTIGWLSERTGRINAALISIIIFAVMSIVCSFADSYPLLLAARFVQGFGLGGEVPVAAAYINEIAKSAKRGRFFLVYECVFLFGLAVCAILGAYVVPRFGYRWMFVIGGLPALVVVVLRRSCPESPRWLASRGRLIEADHVLSGIEREVARQHVLPPVPAHGGATPHGQTRWAEMFQGIYLKRTLCVWILWFCAYLFTYALVTWLPAIYRTVYHVSIQEALLYGIITNLLGLLGGLACAALIDKVGRRIWITGAFTSASIPVLILSLLAERSLAAVIVLSGCASLAITTITIVLYLYTPEIYPTRMRALGTSWATFWPRFSSVLGASLIGAILPHYGLQGVFLLLTSVSAVGGVVAWFGTVETRNRVLEEISP